MERQVEEAGVRPYAPHPSEGRKAGAQAAAEDLLGPSSEGDTAPAVATGRSDALLQSRLPPGFSLVVNDVDAEEPSSAPEEGSDVSESNFGVEMVVAVEPERETVERQGTLRHSSSQKELSDARIKQIQGEVESRKNEFARLLEEHAQVVKQLKAMEEEDGGERGQH